MASRLCGPPARSAAPDLLARMLPLASPGRASTTCLSRGPGPIGHARRVIIVVEHARRRGCRGTGGGRPTGQPNRRWTATGAGRSGPSRGTTQEIAGRGGAVVDCDIRSVRFAFELPPAVFEDFLRATFPRLDELQPDLSATFEAISQQFPGSVERQGAAFGTCSTVARSLVATNSSTGSPTPLVRPRRLGPEAVAEDGA